MIHYIGHYEEKKDRYNRLIFLSAVNKMKYIIDALHEQVPEIQVVSCAMSKDERPLASSKEKIMDNVSLICFKSYGRRNLITRALDFAGMQIQLLSYLFREVKKDDTVIVYHSVILCNVLRFFFSIRKCRFILEMEEIYADVTGDSRSRKKELALTKQADAFIFPTQLLNDAVNSENKPFVVVHGTYKVEKDRKCKFDDGKIHVVYAGTLDPRKGGAIAAAAAAHLPSNYHVHILGFGSEEEIRNMKEMTEEISKLNNAKVTYDGLLSGEEYIQFIQACDIGLSTQNPDAGFNGTSFPSKILSYMANGLAVVTIRIKAIEASAVADKLVFYDTQTPECIAEAVRRVDCSKASESRERVKELDRQFKKAIMGIFEDNAHAGVKKI